MPDAGTQDFEFDPRLLDLHLGHLSAAERTDLRRRIDADPRLAAQDQALTGMFQALDAVPEEPLPSDLTARTLARVKAAGPPPRVIRPADELTAVLEQKPDRIIRLGGNLRDIVAVAALIVLAVGVGIPSMLHMRERSQRIGCSRNLAALGVGLQQYANAFNASLPFAGWGQADSWRPSSEPGVRIVPNHRHVYRLLRMAFVADPRYFICPGQPHVPMPMDEIRRHDDFLESRNVSYAYQNMAGVRPSANDNPRLPVMSDENPLFADGLPLFDARRWGRREPAQTNSHAHRQAGQNLLTLDGSVIWITTPDAGIDGDNIWTLRDVTDYTGREGPSSATDSHLLK